MKGRGLPWGRALLLLLAASGCSPAAVPLLLRRRTLTLAHATAAPERRGEGDEPDYSGAPLSSSLFNCSQPLAAALALCPAIAPTPVLTLQPPAPPLPNCPSADIPNLGALRNPAGVAPAALPLELRMLSHIPILVSSRRSQTSGSPTHVTAKLWLQPVPAAAAHAVAGGAAAAEQAAAGGLREAVSQGHQEQFD